MSFAARRRELEQDVEQRERARLAHELCVRDGTAWEAAWSVACAVQAAAERCAASKGDPRAYAACLAEVLDLDVAADEFLAAAERVLRGADPWDNAALEELVAGRTEPRRAAG